MVFYSRRRKSGEALHCCRNGGVLEQTLVNIGGHPDSVSGFNGARTHRWNQHSRDRPDKSPAESLLRIL